MQNLIGNMQRSVEPWQQRCLSIERRCFAWPKHGSRWRRRQRIPEAALGNAQRARRAATQPLTHPAIERPGPHSGVFFSRYRPPTPSVCPSPFDGPSGSKWRPIPAAFAQFESAGTTLRFHRSENQLSGPFIRLRGDSGDWPGVED